VPQGNFAADRLFRIGHLLQRPAPLSIRRKRPRVKVMATSEIRSRGIIFKHRENTDSQAITLLL
jgi:hypothetical protein